MKELDENVVKTRRTQTGEMLFELKKDSSVKISEYRELIEKSLGSDRVAVDSRINSSANTSSIKCALLCSATNVARQQTHTHLSAIQLCVRVNVSQRKVPSNE